METENKLQRFTVAQMIIVVLLALTQFTVILDFMVMSPLGDVLMKSLNITPKQFGFAVSSYAFSAGLSGLLTAGFADRFDRKKLLLFFYCGFIGGTLLCAIAPTYPSLIIARIVTGLFGGVIGSISLTIITDLFPMHMRGRAMGIMQTGFVASQVLGLPVGLYLSNVWNWHAPFTMIVVLALVIAICILFFLQPVTKHLGTAPRQRILQRYKSILEMKDYQRGFMLTATVYIGGFLMQPFASTFLVNNLKVLPSQLPVIFLCSGIMALIMMPVMGRLSDKIEKFSIFAAGSVWAIIMSLIYTHLPPIPLVSVIIVNILLFMGVLSRNVPATATISAVPQTGDRGAYMSINSSIQQLAGGLAAALAGTIIKQPSHSAPIEHFALLGYVSVVIMLLGIWLMYRVSVMLKNRVATAI